MVALVPIDMVTCFVPNLEVISLSLAIFIRICSKGPCVRATVGLELEESELKFTPRSAQE